MPQQRKNPKVTIDRADKQRRALELRKAGATYSQIAQVLGYTERGGAYKAVMQALRDTVQEPADEVRHLETERLDALLRAMWPQAMEGKGWAVDRCLAVMDRRARLLGLDAPTRTAITVVTEDVIEAEIRRLEAELGIKNAREGGDHRPVIDATATCLPAGTEAPR